MRTKLFLAFIIITLAGLLSTALFAFLILNDFDAYTTSVRDDQIHWIIASVEGGYKNGKWDSTVLSESIHWAMMQGLDIRILDMDNREIIPSHHYLHMLSPNMQKRMEELFHIHADISQPYITHPVYTDGRQIAWLKARSFPKKALAEKEAAFRTRLKDFLYIYLLIAGAGTIVIGFLLSQFLSKPVRYLRKASEKIGSGDFSVRLKSDSADEVGELARTFNRMAESLQREEVVRKHLMSNIAHELRTPLTIMKTQVEAIADGVVTDTSKGLDNIGSEIERLISLVKGIEDVAAAEASFFTKAEPVEINIYTFISGITDELMPAFLKKGITLAFTGPADLSIRADAEKLELAFRNIVSNALKFTDRGSVSVSFTQDRERLLISVSDTGRGIAPEELPYIFDRFFRAAGSGKDGAGIGLSIARELITIIGGEISANSIKGSGSVFTISLPLAD